jgi:hypothetical protein
MGMEGKNYIKEPNETFNVFFKTPYHFGLNEKHWKVFKGVLYISLFASFS